MSTSNNNDRPNVLVVYNDDFDREFVGCYGSECLTPNIDSIADDGLRFDRYYTAAPVCSPSRFCALTGRYATRSENLQREHPPGEHLSFMQEPRIYWESKPHNVAHVLSENGYTTGLVGKWHQGLDEDALEPIDEDADGQDPEVAETLAENYDIVRDAVRSCGFDRAASVYYDNPNYLNVPDDMRHHNMEWVTQGALDFLEENHQDPFFLWMAPTPPHAPRGTDQLETDPRSTPAGYLESEPDVQRPREEVIQRVEEAGIDALGRGPHATWADDGIGAVLDKLDELGIADNTLVIFTSDHADVAGKGTTYQRGSRMPFVARWPAAIESGRPCTRLASNVDLAPTIFDVTGVEPDPEYEIDGQSFRPLLTGDGEYERESLYQEIGAQRAVLTADGFHYAATRFPEDIRAEIDRGATYNHRWEEVDGPGETKWFPGEDFPCYFDRDQLYDLETDPGERHNLADDPRYADKLAELQELLAEYSSDLPHAFGEFTDEAA